MDMSTDKPDWIYLSVLHKNEYLELSHGIDNDSIKGLFRVVGETCSSELLKIYNHQGLAVQTLTNLPANTPSTRYKLEVAKIHKYNSDNIDGLVNSSYNFVNKFKLTETDYSRSYKPYSCGQLSSDNGRISSAEDLQEKIEIGLAGHVNNHGDPPAPPSLNSSSLSSLTSVIFNKCQVLAEYDNIKDRPVERALLQRLRNVDFNNWSHSEAQLMVFMQHIISDFNINKIYNIEQETMQRWMRRIFLGYNDAPFHNFKHSFCVTQMIYAMLKTLDLSAKLAPLDIFILLFSGACHDLDHTGFNNTFHINAQTELALRYNDASPLENHHSATAFHILQDEDCNILKNMEPSDYLTFRRGVIRCILATDLAKHDAILDEFIAVLPLFDFKNNSHKLLLSMILIKIADISNEARPVECANIWMECLFQEYFHQSDVEKFKGLQVTPYMDRETVSKCKSQIAFIKTLLLPLIKSLHTLCPGSKEITRAVQRNMNHYMLRDK